MVRTIAGALLCIGCVLCAVAVRKRYLLKRDFAAEICCFIASAKSDVRFLKTPLMEIIRTYKTAENVKREAAKNFGALLEKVSECKSSGKPVVLECELLKPEENKELCRFFEGFGKSDGTATVDSLERFGEYFAEVQRRRTEESKRLGDMYFKLLIILGLALLIIVA